MIKNCMYCKHLYGKNEQSGHCHKGIVNVYLDRCEDFEDKSQADIHVGQKGDKL